MEFFEVGIILINVYLNKIRFRLSFNMSFLRIKSYVMIRILTFPLF